MSEKYPKAHMVIRCPGRKAIRLRPGRTLKIGRHRTNDLVINDGTVSRFHAAIVWDADEDRPYIQDNASANGITVDGDPIEGRGYLPDSHQVEIGEFLITTELRGMPKLVAGGDPGTSRIGGEDPGEPTALIDSPTSVRLFSEAGEEFEGRFNSLQELKRVLLYVEDEERTGTLHLRIGARAWSVTYSQGLIVTAKRGEIRGMAAVKEFLLRESEGTYQFSLDLEPCEENLSLSVKFLLSAGGDETSISFRSR